MRNSATTLAVAAADASRMYENPSKGYEANMLSTTSVRRAFANDNGRVKRMFFIVVLSVALANAATLQTHATAKASVDLYEKPDKWSEKAGTLTKGQRYVYDSIVDGYFRIVSDNQNLGWVYKDHISPRAIDHALRIRARLYTAPQKNHNKVLRELSDKIIASVLEKQSGWYRVHIANGEEGWVPREWTEPVRASIMRAGRGAAILDEPLETGSALGELHKGDAFLPIAKKRLYIQCLTEDGIRGWVKNPLYPDSLVIAESRDIPVSQSTVPEGAISVTVGEIVEPLESVGGQWWIRTKAGESGFIDKSKTGPYFKGAAASPATQGKEIGSGAIGAAKDSIVFPDPGARDFTLRIRIQCGLVDRPADDADTIEVLEAGFEFKPLRVYGVFYEVKGASGKKGWVNTAFVAANPAEPMRVFVDARMHATPDSSKDSYLGNAWVKKNERVIMSDKAGNWALVTRKDGLRGWIYQGTVMPVRRIPGGTNMFLFPKFRSLHQLAGKNGLLGIPIWIFFILVFLTPAIIARVLVDFAGNRSILPNWVVKLSIPLAVILPTAYLAPHIIQLPPFYYWDIQFFWAPVWILYGVGAAMLFWKDIGRHRCPACHAMKAGHMYDTRQQTITTKTTTTYSDGSRYTNRDSATSGNDYMQCRYCGQCWVYSWTDFR